MKQTRAGTPTSQKALGFRLRVLEFRAFMFKVQGLGSRVLKFRVEGFGA